MSKLLYSFALFNIAISAYLLFFWLITGDHVGQTRGIDWMVYFLLADWFWRGAEKKDDRER